MLSAREILENREKISPELPTFGVKDFQPKGSLEESYQIQHSVNEIRNIISHKTVKLVNSLSQAVWHQDLDLAEVTHQTGSCWSYMGHMIGQKLYIYPEEALYLLETGSIQITYNEVPLSVQRAYFVFLNSQNGITLEKYRVYSLLHGYGFKVLRHSPKNSVTDYERKLEVHKVGIKLKNCGNAALTEKKEQEASDELKSDVMKTFPVKNKISYYNIKVDKVQELPSCHTPKVELNFDFDIYSESSVKQTFRKSCLQLPNFRVIIHRGEDPVPEFEELCKLTSKYEDNIPVIHAIVFFDYVALYKINPFTLPDLNS